ncbi:MAG: hypothetical protein KDA89_20140, partial [Planctomycetaceae bacterium]|nr:hypothetical protein [Planctomycetaceae bacterium]
MKETENAGGVMYSELCSRNAKEDGSRAINPDNRCEVSARIPFSRETDNTAKLSRSPWHGLQSYEGRCAHGARMLM